MKNLLSLALAVVACSAAFASPTSASPAPDEPRVAVQVDTTIVYTRATGFVESATVIAKAKSKDDFLALLALAVDAGKKWQFSEQPHEEQGFWVATVYRQR